jgi:hypothetical protein
MLVVQKGVSMRFFIIIYLIVSFISCATQKHQSIPVKQAMGLNEVQGKNLISAIDEGYSMIVGNGYFFCLKSPNGWIIDQSSDVIEGFNAVFYQKNYSWDEATNIIFLQVVLKEEGYGSLIEMIDRSIINYKMDYPTLNIKDLGNIVTEKGIKVKVMGFTGGAKPHEAIAYIDEPNVLIMIIFRCLNQNDYDAHFPVFKELVRSYVYIGEFGLVPNNN